MSSRERKYHFDNYHLDEPIQYGDISLYQIGDAYCESGIKFAPHIQICHEISYIASGCGTFFADGRGYLVKAGDLFLSPLGTEHMIHSSVQNPLRYYYCGFSLAKKPASKRFRALEKFFSAAPKPLATDCYNNIQMVFSLLLEELMINDKENRDRLIEIELEQLLLLTHRCYEEGSAGKKVLQSSDLKQNLVYNIIHYIDDNIFTIHALTDISNHLGYSYSYIAQVFSSVVGVRLNSYYRQKRFEKATQLLQESGSATWVSEAMGFDSVQSFSRFFKSCGGSPPSEFIRRHGSDGHIQTVSVSK